MCLSVVYLDKKDGGEVVAEEVATIAGSENGVEVSTLFGEKKTVEGYTIGEVSLTDNYVILSRKVG